MKMVSFGIIPPYEIVQEYEHRIQIKREISIQNHHLEATQTFRMQQLEAKQLYYIITTTESLDGLRVLHHTVDDSLPDIDSKTVQRHQHQLVSCRSSMSHLSVSLYQSDLDLVKLHQQQPLRPPSGEYFIDISIYDQQSNFIIGLARKKTTHNSTHLDKRANSELSFI